MVSETCPGTQSDQAGKSSACEGCPNASYCSQPKQKDPDMDYIRQNTSTVRKFIAVMSGKGGVGKSTFTVNLANALSQTNTVCILDLDISGPSIPRLTGTENEIIFETNSTIYPIQITDRLSVISLGHFASQDVTYGSKTKNTIMKRILKDTVFEPDSIVIIDTPPGITDEHLAITSWISLDCSILITSPQKVVLSDVVRQIDFCSKSGLKILGIVENMKHFICKNCNHTNQVFKSNSIDDYCQKAGIAYLGSIKLDPRISQASDRGAFIEEKTMSLICESISANGTK